MAPRAVGDIWLRRVPLSVDKGLWAPEATWRGPCQPCVRSWEAALGSGEEALGGRLRPGTPVRLQAGVPPTPASGFPPSLPSRPFSPPPFPPLFSRPSPSPPPAPQQGGKVRKGFRRNFH